MDEITTENYNDSYSVIRYDMAIVSCVQIKDFRVPATNRIVQADPEY